MGAPPSEPTDGRRGLSRGLVALFALTAGAGVANVYYVQPLLNTIAADFGVDDGSAGLLVTFSQVGYLAGLLLLVPAGDLLERRRLITGVLATAAVAASAAAAAPNLAMLAAALAAVGVFSVVVQIIIPLSSSLAHLDQQGRVVGTIVSGALIGVLIARTASGLIAEVAGWRAVYVVAAALMLILSLTLRRLLPEAPATGSDSYRAVLRSMLTLVRREPVLRQRMVIGGCAFGCFSVLWTSIAFLLGSPPYDYSEGVIGLFGLAGLAGALVAPLSGRFVDRGHSRLAVSVFLLVLLISWGLLAIGSTSLISLVAGIVVLDLGAQGAHIVNQTTIYSLDPDAGGRLTAAYIVAVYVGMTAGSTFSTIAYESGGWNAVCAVGAAMALGAIVVWGLTRRLRPPVQPTEPPAHSVEEAVLSYPEVA